MAKEYITENRELQSEEKLGHLGGGFLEWDGNQQCEASSILLVYLSWEAALKL